MAPLCAGTVAPHQPIVESSQLPPAMLETGAITTDSARGGMDTVARFDGETLAQSSFADELPLVPSGWPAHEPQPPVIAAPLPPALLSGLIGLAGVYAYRRRHRLR